MRPVAGAPARRTALVVVLLAGAAFVGLAAWLVPWHPVPGGTPPAVPAASVLSPDQIATAERYARWARVWGWGSIAVSTLVLARVGLGRGALGRRVVGALPGVRRGRWALPAALAVVLVLLAARVATLPLAIAAHLHARDYGLTTQGWGGFARDVVVGQVVSTATTVLGVLALIGCARRFPRRWPAVAGGLAAGLVLAGSFAYPVLVEPLFNHFTPLPDGSLRTAVLALADREGVHVDDVLVADASRRTTTINAYVSGFGDTRRVVLYDTLVRDLDQRAALSVVAHELTHAREDDVLHGSLIGAAGAALGVGLLGLLLGGRRRQGSSTLGAEVVPRVLALVAIASVLATPVENTMSRAVETRADVGALEATRDPEAFVRLQQQLALRSLADPTPPAASQFWFGSHPTQLQRIAIAEQLAPSLTGR